MRRFEKYISIEGGYIDCQMTNSQLLLWDIEGSVAFFNLSDIKQLKQQYPQDIIPNKTFRERVIRRYDVPGRALPSDTTIMDGKLYTASENGLFTGAARHQQLWDARLFRLQKNDFSPIMAIAGGDDGLFELNVSQVRSKGLRLAEKTTKDIYRVSNSKSHYTSYLGYNITGSSKEEEILAVFNQQKGLREYIREEKSLLDVPYIPEKYIIDNGIAFFRDDDKLDFIQLRKGSAQREEITLNANSEIYGDVLEVTTNDLHTNFEFDNGLVIMADHNELLRISEPVARWRSFVIKNKTEECLIALLNDRFEIYHRSLAETLPDTSPQETDNNARATSKDLINHILGSKRSFKDGEEACRILNAIINRFGGWINIDFLDLDNWDRIESVYYDKSTNLMMLIKERPSENEDYAAHHRAVWGGIDAFATIVRFNELCIVEYGSYPFVTINTSNVFPSIVKNYLSRVFGNISDAKDSMYGTNFIIQRKNHNWFVRCLNNNLTSAVWVGKDKCANWREVDSSRLMMLENLDSIKRNIWLSSILVSRSLAKKLFKTDRIILEKIDRSLYQNFKDLMKIDLAVKDVFYNQSYCEKYSADDNETMRVIGGYRKESVGTLYNIRDSFVILRKCESIDYYRKIHEDINSLLMHYISIIEDDIRIARIY